MSRQDAHTIPPEAIRQIGAAIQFAAAAAGASIPGDPSLVNQIWNSLGPAERAALSSGDGGAVRGKIDALIEHQAQLKAQTKLAVHLVGPALSDAERGIKPSATARGISELLRDGAFGQQSRNEKASGSSAKYAEAGMAVPGNADARGFDIRNYYTSPVTKGLVDMGVTDNTYDHVRQNVPGVSTDNIRRAARDADKMGFDVNNERMVKNHAIIRHKDKEADKTNKNLQEFGKGLDDSKEFREAALALKNAQSEEERKQALARIKEISDGLAKKHGVTEDMARQRVQTVTKAIGEIKGQKVEDKVKEIHQAAPGPPTTAAQRIDPKLANKADALLQAADAELAAAKPGPAKSDPAGDGPAKAKPDVGTGEGPTVAPKVSTAPAPKN